MPSLEQFQRQLRGAIIGGDTTPLAALLTGGKNPQKRLAIHLRHFETSLTRALVEKYPALGWIAGTDYLTEAAHLYVRAKPPSAPCIAEYGEDFPAFLASRPGAERVPYMRALGELEWHLGHVALAIDHPALGLDALSGIAPDRLPDISLTLQPGLRYLAANWPVDELMKLFLSDNAPAQYLLENEDIFLEILGARGSFDINRLDAGAFVFRSAMAGGQSIGAAAECAIEADPAFEPGGALATLFAAGHVTAIGNLVSEER